MRGAALAADDEIWGGSNAELGRLPAVLLSSKPVRRIAA
jgi:hypothetical protein